jgi:polysaccharide export outer membrane protein
MRLFRRASWILSPGPIWLTLLVVAVVLAPATARSEYKLQPGDILEVLITGVPDFRQRTPIGAEGDVGLPLAGQIKVGDLSVAEARARIAGELSNKLYRQFTNDGREISHLIVGTEVVVSVADYRPVFVDGDVTKPGEYAFRPGMTVRQAIAVAGGFDVVRAQGPDPVLQSADLQAEYQTLWQEIAAEQARSWRLRTELADIDNAHGDNTGADNKIPLPADVNGDLMQGEVRQYQARKTDLQNSKALLREAINKATQQLAILAEKKTKDDEGSQADLADFKTVRDLFQKGLAPITRLSEARRASLLSSEQLLQTMVEASNLERQRDEYTRQLASLDSLRRIDDLLELQKTNLHLAELTGRVKIDSDKLTHIGLLRSQVAAGGGRKVAIAVHRKTGNGQERLNGNEDLELAPGDVVEVLLQGQTATSTIASSAKIQ